MKDLGEDLSDTILDVIGTTLDGQTILVRSGALSEFIIRKDEVQKFKKLREDYGITLITAPFISGKSSIEDLETAIGNPIGDFGGLLGFGSYLDNSSIDTMMINSPAIESLTEDKLIQYTLLKDVPGLNMPQTWLIDEQFYPQYLPELQKIYGTLVNKPRYGKQGKTINLFDANITEYITNEMILMYSENKHRRRFRRTIRSLLKRVYNPDKNIKINSKEHERIAKLYESNPEHAIEETKKRFDYHARLFQTVVETQPVKYNETGDLHYASARLIWFGEYLGGYWRLSENPVGSDDPSGPIVNYSISHLGQKFTPEETAMFKQYAEQVVPPISSIAAGYNGNSSGYKDLEHKMLKEMILGKAPLSVNAN